MSGNINGAAIAAGKGSTASITHHTHHHHYADNGGISKKAVKINTIVVPGGVGSLTKNHYQNDLSELLNTYRVVCIHGMGGTGKSILAKTEAIKKDTLYAVRFEITANSDNLILSGLIDLYEACHGKTKTQELIDEINKAGSLQNRARKVLMPLRSTLKKIGHNSSLLVLDNVQKETPFLRQVIDTLTETRFLITTRDNQMLASRSQGAQPTVGSLPLNAGWTQSECLNLLGEDLGSLEERKSLADYLPLPLGLRVADKTIRHMKKNPVRSYSCEKYLSVIRSGLNDSDETKALKFSSEKDLNQRQTEVLKQSMWAIDSQGGKSLLQFISRLSPQPIPYALINDYFEELFEALSSSDRMDLLDEGLRHLESMSLVDTVMEEGSIHALSIHELVQDVARRVYSPGSNVMAIMSSTLMTSLNVDDRLLSDSTQRKRIESVLPHIEAFAENMNREDAKRALMYYNLGNVYDYLGDATKQKEMLEHALVIFEAHHDPDHPIIANMLVSLGNACGSLGDATKQKELLERGLMIQEAYYGPDHSEVAITLINLGGAYHNLGDASKYNELLERALVIVEASYQPDHPIIATTLASLGSACGALGDENKKKELLESALVIAEAYYEPDHPKIAEMLANLGDSFGALGDENKRKELLERALVIFEAYYGPDHPNIAKTLVNLGNACGALGDANKRKELLERALTIKMAYYNPDSLEVAIVLFNLCMARLDLKESSHDVISDLTRVNTIFKDHFGFDHLHTKLVRDTLLSVELNEQSLLSWVFSFFHEKEKHGDALDHSPSRTGPDGASLRERAP